MRIIILLSLITFISCKEKVEQKPEIEVLDTQMAALIRPDEMSKKDSLALINTFKIFRNALCREDGILLSQLSTEKKHWPSSLNGMLNIPITLPGFLITSPKRKLYNIDIWHAIYDSTPTVYLRNQTSIDENDPFFTNAVPDIYEVNFSTKRTYKKEIIGTEHSFEFIKTGDSFKFQGYQSREESWQHIYPSIDSITAYFPRSGLKKLHEQKEGYLTNFCNIWYSEILKACNEPVLCEYKGEDEVYRFTWLRSFHMPVVISIRKSNFDFSLTANILKQGYYDHPDEIVINSDQFIDAFMWGTFKNKIRQAGFWDMPLEDKQTEVGTDGATWVLEGVKNGKYNVAYRWSAKRSKFGEACLYLLAISELEISEEDIY